MLENVARRVKHGDGAVCSLARQVVRWSREASMPCLRPVHILLYYERLLRHRAWWKVLETAYYSPLFRARCASVGRGLRLECAMPQVLGNLEIRIGDKVTISGVNTFSTNNSAERPVLSIGDQCYIGHQVSISVAASVTIGSRCLIADRVMISDNDGHPLDPERRAAGLPPPDEAVRPEVLEDDVWVCSRAVVLKGVRIGAGAVVAAGAVVTQDVPPLTVAAGNPARVVKRIAVDGPAAGFGMVTDEGT
ncbi:MAG: acyltransferase [Armatimonadota bacterium]